MGEKPHDIVAYNKRMWDAKVAQGDRWTVPVEPDVITRAREGDFAIVLTPSKPVPHDWYPELEGCRLLCLASGGGQQAPVLAAAGAEVTVFDNSPAQLAQDRLVAEREGLKIETVEGDMRDLSCFDDASFDFIFHPCSNTYVEDVTPVWREAFRVLRPGGELVAGFCNPLLFIFDEELREKGELQVRHRIPYSDLDDLTADEFARYAENNDPVGFGHTLDDQIGAQIQAGFLLTGFYEDDWGPTSDDMLSKYIKAFIATKATKPGE